MGAVYYDGYEAHHTLIAFREHPVVAESNVALVIDIFEPASPRIQKALDAIERSEAQVVMFVCLVNSDTEHFYYRPEDDPWASIPIVSLMTLRLRYYSQEDPRVADDIKEGHVI